MSTFDQQQLAQRARNANSVTVMIGDTVLGFAQTTSHSMDYGTQALRGVGSAMPQEIQQLLVSPQITIDSFALTDNGLQVLGYPVNLASILANQQFDMHIVDGASGDPIFTYVGCVAQNFSENIPANQPISDSITFLAMDVLDATGQSILNAGNAYPIPSAGASSSGNGLGISA
jgi:hypothetical protein